MKNELLISLRGKTPRLVVATTLRITPQGLGMIERGERIPRPDLMKRIADYYDKTVGLTTGLEYMFSHIFSLAAFYRPAIYSFGIKSYKRTLSIEARFNIKFWKKE